MGRGGGGVGTPPAHGPGSPLAPPFEPWMRHRSAPPLAGAVLRAGRLGFWGAVPQGPAAHWAGRPTPPAQEDCRKNLQEAAKARGALASYHPFWLRLGMEIVVGRPVASESPAWAPGAGRPLMPCHPAARAPPCLMPAPPPPTTPNHPAQAATRRRPPPTWRPLRASTLCGTPSWRGSMLRPTRASAPRPTGWAGGRESACNDGAELVLPKGREPTAAPAAAAASAGRAGAPGAEARAAAGGAARPRGGATGAAARHAAALPRGGAPQGLCRCGHRVSAGAPLRQPSWLPTVCW